MSSQKTIMIVEDNELNMKLFRDILQAHGFRVVALRDGSAAVATARTEQPAVIVMDIGLSAELTGLDVTRLLKSDPVTKPIPVVAVTAFAMKGDEERFREGGCDGYLAKPISVNQFLTTIQQFIGQS